jgi:hypothetical protein
VPNSSLGSLKGSHSRTLLRSGRFVCNANPSHTVPILREVATLGSKTKGTRQDAAWYHDQVRKDTSHGAPSKPLVA